MLLSIANGGTGAGSGCGPHPGPPIGPITGLNCKTINININRSLKQQLHFFDILNPPF